MPQTSIDHVETMLATQEKRVARAIRDFLKITRSDFIVAEIEAMLEKNDAEAAMRLVDSYVYRMGDDISQVIPEVGRSTAQELGAILPDLAIAVSFDPTFPRAADLIRANRLRFVAEFTDAQRKATRAALVRAMNEGAGPREVSRAFRFSIGLTALQEGHVASYRARLETLDRKALDRELRDRRTDDRVERAIARNRPLTQNQIDAMVNRYRANYLDKRAQDIARTEALTATSIARDEALEQMVARTSIPRERVTRIWHPHRDTRTREYHATMDGQRVKMGEAFVDGLGNRLMYPGDRQAPVETFINCRCGTTFEIAPPA